MIPVAYTKVNGVLKRTEPAPVAYTALDVRLLQHRIFIEGTPPPRTFIVIRCR